MLLSQNLLEREYDSPLDRSLQTILLEYYKLIDEHKIDQVVNLFSQTAHYLRCGEIYSGIEAIEKFYKSERKIRGSHEIDNLWIIKQTGIVEGIFRGYPSFVTLRIQRVRNKSIYPERDSSGS